MKLYNPEKDILVRNVKPFFRSGMVVHYVASNADTGEVVRIEVTDLNNWQDTRYVDVNYLRGQDVGDIDEFMSATM